MHSFDHPSPSVPTGGVTFPPPEPGAVLPLGSLPHPFLGRLKTALLCGLLAALAGVAIQAFLLLHAATVAARALPGAVSAELAAARADLTGQVAAARQDLLARTERQVAALRTDVMGEAAQIRSTADRRVGDTLARVDTALGKVEELRGDLKPVLANAATLTQHADALTGDAKDSLDDLYFDVKASVASATVAANSFGQMSLDAKNALPAAITTWQGIGTNVKATTEASTEASRSTARVMKNFATATKPLPTWARIGLAVAPPIAQVGVSVATTLAVTGKVGK